MKISNFFSSMSSGVDNEVTSRITIPIIDTLKESPENERVFSGTFALNQVMYGSSSSATIRIIINNEEKFSTGEINENTLVTFPYNVNYGDADSIIIETSAVLRGSDFIFGIVDSK